MADLGGGGGFGDSGGGLSSGVGDSGRSLQEWKHVDVSPGPTNPPLPPETTPPPVIPKLDVSQTTWGQPRPSSFGVREITGVPLWVSDPDVKQVTTTSNVTTVSGPSLPPTTGASGLTRTGAGDSGRSLQDWNHPQPSLGTPQTSQIIITSEIVTCDFAIGFGRQTRPAGERVNSRLLKLYADGLLIYTVDGGFTGSLEGLTVTWHPGYADAVPDVTIQTAVGEHCPAFRDEMYVVVRGYPIASNSAKLPVIRALISDIAADADPEATAYSVGAVNIHDDGLFVDQRAKVMFGFDTTVTNPHTIYAYDMVNHAEIGHTELLLGFPLLLTDNPYWAIYDPDNSLVMFQYGTAISNSMSIAVARIQDGSVLDTFGTQSSELSSSEDGFAISEYASFMKYRAAGLTCYGLVMGGIFTEVKYMGYTHSPTTVTSNGVPVTMTRGGYVQGNDLTLVYDGALNLPGNVNAMVSYPVLDRPELMQAYNVANAQFQDHVCLVAYGSQIVCITAGLQVEAGALSDLVFGVHGNQIIADIGGGAVDEMFIAPDGDIMVIVAVGGTRKLNKFHPVWTQTANGITIASMLAIYRDVEVAGYNTGGMRNAIRMSNLASGFFGYVGESNHFVVVELASGAIIYDSLLPVNIGEHWSFDGYTNGIECAAVVTGKVTHVDLFGPVSDDGVPLVDVLGWFAQDLGYEEDEITSTGIDDTVLGGIIATPTSVRELMSNMSQVYDYDQVENGGFIKFVRSARNEEASVATLKNDALSPISEFVGASDPSSMSSSPTSFGQGGSPDVNNLQAIVAAPNEVPADTSITYLDPDAGYIENTQIFRRVRFPFETVQTDRTADYSLPFVMTATDALQRAGRLTFAGFGNSIVFNWRLPHQYLALEPADVVTVLDRDEKANLVKITQMMQNSDWSFSMSGINWSFSDNIALTADSPLGKRDPKFHGPSDSLPFAFDVPLLTPGEEVPGAVQVYMALGNQFGYSFWEGAKMLRQLAGGSLTELATFTIADVYGYCDIALPASNASGTTFQTDNDTVLKVSARAFDSSKLDSAPDELTFLAGINRAMIGRPGRWELVYYRDVTVVDGHTATLNGLLRGRRGTEGSCDLHDTGDFFVMLPPEGFRRDTLASTDVGKVDTYYAQGFNVTSAPRVDILSPLTGATAKPWAPVHQAMVLGSTLNATPATDYFNLGGGGNNLDRQVSREGLIAVTANFTPVTASLLSNLVDGEVTGNDAESLVIPNGLTNAIITFDFHGTGFKQVIDAISWEQSNSTNQGTYDIEASDDGVAWDSLASAQDIVDGSSFTETTFTNTTGYWYYRLKQVGGTTSNSPFVHEIYFNIMADVQPNDLLIRWVRRDRLGQEFVTAPQPLSETTEKYDLEILSGDTVVRTVSNLTSPQYTYLAADQSTDGFSPPLASLRVKVYQLSTLVGRGFAGDATMFSA